MEPVKVSQTKLEMPVRMLPQDANPAGNVHGGMILRYIDLVGGMVATRHARSPVVTASIDRMDFLAASYVGEIVTFKACVNYTGRTSMEVGVRVESENPLTGEVRHAGSAYLTFVAMDDKCKPRPIAQILPQSAVELRRHAEAILRREARLLERQRERSTQESADKTANEHESDPSKGQ